MPSTGPLDILKQAILLEKRGKIFYRTMAAQAQSEALRTFFEMMAEEECRHVEILSEQFRSMNTTGEFSPAIASDKDQVADRVLSKEIASQISAASFEAAAVSAAMAMEQRAIKLYAQQANASTDEKEIALFKWLSEWEQGHLQMLAQIDRELTESIWQDNNFWPF